MAALTPSRSSRTISSIKRVFNELDYAQRRLLEIRTGVPMVRPENRPGTASTVDELEALYAHDDPRLSDL